MKKYLLFSILSVSFLGCVAVDSGLENKALYLADDIVLASCSLIGSDFSVLESLKDVSDEDLQNKEFISLLCAKLAELIKEVESGNVLTPYMELLVQEDVKNFIQQNKNDLQNDLNEYLNKVNNKLNSEIELQKENSKEIEFKINKIKETMGDEKEILFNFEKIQNIYKKYLIEKIVNDLIEKKFSEGKPSFKERLGKNWNFLIYEYLGVSKNIKEVIKHNALEPLKKLSVYRYLISLTEYIKEKLNNTSEAVADEVVAE